MFLPTHTELFFPYTLIKFKCHVSMQESTFNEQVEGLIEEDEETEETEHAAGDSVGPTAQREKKTERQRKKEKAERIKVRKK